MSEQLTLALNPTRNSFLFSNHWLENRLPLEPDWDQHRPAARAALDQLAEYWKTHRKLLPKLGVEAALEQQFIQPALQQLGWTLFYQPFLQGRKPDYALFLNPEHYVAAVGTGRNTPEFWRHPAVVADAKAWDVSLDRKTAGRDREYPPEQIEWYLDKSRLGFGILTNGRVWRLVPRERDWAQPRFQTYFECDLERLLDEWTTTRNLTRQAHLLVDFERFFLFFGPAGHTPSDDRLRLVERALKGSSEYRIGVGEGLRDRAFEALRLCVEGFLSLPTNGLYAKTDLHRCREQSFIVLYRLLFILFAEDRQLLPYGKNHTYTNNRSLRRLRDEITARLSAGRMNRHAFC